MWGISKMDPTVSKKKSRIGMYEVGRTLGEGRYAKVKLGRHIETGSQVAIKIMQKDRLRKADKLVRQEISTMKLIKHPHVVRLLEVLASKKNAYIILEYVHGGELFDKIVEKGRLSEDDARKYFRQLIRGVDYCHSRGVYHRDLKPENLLLDKVGNLKISDFGLSVLSHQHRDDGLFHTTCGTPSYVAPEVLDGKGYEGAPADLWSCGIILYVLLAGTLPFNDSNLSNLSLKIHKAELDFSSTFPTEPRELIRKLLDPNPKTRLTIQGVFENEWFNAGELLETDTCDDLQLCPAIDDDFVQDMPIGDSRPVLMNAFEIILALSEGLDLSGLFIEKEETRKKEAKFASMCPANEIMLKIEEFARGLDYRVWSKNYKMNLLSSKPGRKGFISISIEVLEVTPSLFMVDMHKTNGDTLEYCDFQQKLSVGLKDIVWRAEETTESRV